MALYVALVNMVENTLVDALLGAAIKEVIVDAVVLLDGAIVVTETN